ncbi:MAG: SPOR domain-containing protein [Gammaproteobacteria bacterium]|nr:SPOR domain-containing protein [Gammaproteobacteria bacterium]
MAQARRIKPKPVSKARKQRKSLKIPWGLLVVILLSGVVIGLLFNGAMSGDSRFGAGLAQLLENNEADTASDRDIVELIENKSTEKAFEFYELLPDIERVMPDDLPEATPSQPIEGLDYFLQAASFREYEDAEKLRARLALRGFSSVTQAREVEGKGTFYRVRLGPYADKRKAKTAKNKLHKVGVRPFIYTVKK